MFPILCKAARKWFKIKCKYILLSAILLAFVLSYIFKHLYVDLKVAHVFKTANSLKCFPLTKFISNSEISRLLFSHSHNLSTRKLLNAQFYLSLSYQQNRMAKLCSEDEKKPDLHPSTANVRFYIVDFFRILVIRQQKSNE